MNKFLPRSYNHCDIDNHFYRQNFVRILQNIMQYQLMYSYCLHMRDLDDILIFQSRISSHTMSRQNPILNDYHLMNRKPIDTFLRLGQQHNVIQQRTLYPHICIALHLFYPMSTRQPRLFNRFILYG